MIILEELESTLKRMEIIANNSDNPEEKVMYSIMKNNLYTFLVQAKQLAETAEFKEEVKKNENIKK
mgnify:FL=1|jgi:hypothetical protein